MRSWPKKWNDASLRQIATLPEASSSRPWALVGMFAIGLVAGAAIGGYAVSQRSMLRQLGQFTDWTDDQGTEEVSVTSHRSNHRPRTKAGVK
ncbi:MAG: hypothetical protein ABI455_11405 [Candidatus Dormiibacterota bacterium]